MSQQQDSQGSFSQFEDDQEQYPLSSSKLIQGKGRIHEGPKSEHPSTYDESIPPLSYHAQDYEQASPSARVGASPTPTNKAYSQYTGGRQAPFWAGPRQKDFGTLRLVVLLIIGIILFPVLFYIIVNILIPVIAIIAMIALLVLIVLGALLLAVMIIAILWVIARIDRIRPPSWW